ACFGEPDAHADLGHRYRTFGEESFRMLDAPVRVVTVRRLSEGLLEGSAEMIGAETGKLGERCERNRFGKMLLDIGGDNALLPGGEPAAEHLLGAAFAPPRAHQFVDQNMPECLQIAEAVDVRAL